MSTTALGPVQRLAVWGRFVKFSHSVFALPFALSVLFVVVGEAGVSIHQIGWILVAIVSARTAAMGFNRIVDRSLDQLNPRTRTRELPAGEISLAGAIGLVMTATALFLISSYVLGVHCLKVAPLVLAVLFFYSYTKRFTGLSHIVLGLALALAPGGVWYALVGTFAIEPIPLMMGVIFWVAGFDILYACQDVEFDRAVGLHSVPSRIGKEKAFRLSQLFHLFAIGLLVWFGILNELGILYYIGLGVFAGILASQYLSVSPDNLEKINQVFFVRNGLASIVFFVGVALDRLLLLS